MQVAGDLVASRHCRHTQSTGRIANSRLIHLEATRTMRAVSISPGCAMLRLAQELESKGDVYSLRAFDALPAKKSRIPDDSLLILKIPLKVYTLTLRETTRYLA